MRALILSCDTGGGHNTCAKAIQEAFAQHGCSCEVKDSAQFVSPKLSKFISWGHTVMYRHIPMLFRFGYSFAEKHPGMTREDAATYKLLTGGTEQLYRFLQEGNYDTVICTHIFSGLLLRQTCKEYSISLKTALVATDYTCSPGTARSEPNRYFIPSDSLRVEFIAQGVPAEKITPSGIPIRREFYEQKDKADAKRKLGIDPKHTHLLMMCGSMGCGPMRKLTKRISSSMDETVELSIVCGTNEKLRRKMAKEFSCFSNVHIYGFVKNMADMMDSADLYLTKPGGLSTTEAAAKQLPMVFIDAVAGCEKYNLNYFIQLGGAVTAGSLDALVQYCLSLIKNPERLAQMKAALETYPQQKAADVIYETMCKGWEEGAL